MLILTRRTDEEIVIGPDITITVLAADSNQVKLGIAAPEEISVCRREVRESIAAEQAEDPVEVDCS